MAFDAGSVYATLGGRFSNAGFHAFGSAMYKARADMEATEKRAEIMSQRSRRSFEQMGHAGKIVAAGGVLALGAAIAYSVKKAADFEQQLSSLQAVSGANARQMAELKKQALDAGAATKYSALQAAQAQTELAKGGLSTAQILKGGLKGALALAAAGELELADAAKYTVNAIKLFKLEGSQATHVADALAQAANQTTADVQDFGMALTQGGGAAKSAGYSFNETITLLEAMAEVGVKNSDAGTSMKTALLQLVGATDKQKNAAKGAGLSFLDQQGKMKSLTAISDMLRAKTGDMTKAQRTALFQTLAGTDGFRTLLALYDAGPQKLSRLERGLEKQGTAAEVAAKKQDNLKGRIENMMGSIETAGIQVGTHFLPVLTQAAEDFTGTINDLAKSGKLDDFAQGVIHGGDEAIRVLGDLAHAGQDVAGVMLDVGRALELGDATHIEAILAGIAGFKVAGAVAPMVFSLANGISTLILNARTAPSAMAFMSSLPIGPVGAIAAGVAALAGGLVLLSGREDQAARTAREAAEAHKALEESIRGVMDAERADADKGLAAKQSTLDHKRAVEDLHAAAKKYGKDSPEYRRALLDEQRAALRSAQAHEDYGKAVKKTSDENATNVRKSVEQQHKALKQLADARWDIGGYMGAPQVGSDGHLSLSMQRYANALDAVKKANADYIQALARQQVSELSRQRLMQSSTQITQKNAEGVALLIRALDGVPTDRQTKILLNGDQAALARVGNLIATVKDVPTTRAISTVLRGDESVKVKLAAVTALAKGVPSKKVMDILGRNEDAKTKIEAIRRLQIPTKKATVVGNTADVMGKLDSVIDKLDHLPASKTVTVGINDAASSALGRIANKLGQIGNATVSPRPPGRAAGRGKIGAEQALVGEGRGPEWVADPATGRMVKVTHPTLMELPPTAYVIPTEDRYRGRALGLLAELANDLGVAYAKGKAPAKKAPAKKPAAPKQLPVPDRIALGGTPFDDVKQQYDSTQSDYTQAKKQVTTAKNKVASQQHRLDRVPGNSKHHNYDRERSNARDAVARAKREQHQAEAHRDRVKKLYDRQRTLYLAAKKTNDQTNDLETAINLDRDRMADANRKHDEKAYGRARDDRKGDIRKLIAIMQKALALADPTSQYARGLKERLSQLGGSTAVTGIPGVPIPDDQAGGDLGDPAFSDAEQQAQQDAQQEAAPPQETEADRIEQTGMTDAERADLEKTDADMALAALTPDLHDDVAPAQHKVDLLTRILGEVQADLAGHGGYPVVKDIADQLKSASDNLTSLTAPATATSAGGDLTQQVRDQLASADQQRRDLFSEFGSNFMDLGGAHFFGAGRPQVSVVNNYQEPPADPHTWSRNLVFDLQAAVG